VREGILSRTNAPALTGLNRPKERSEDPRAETTTDMQSSTTGDDFCERDKGAGTASHEHGTYNVTRQPSWHDMSQPTPGRNIHKRKRTASIVTNRNGEDQSSEGAGKPRSASDTENFDVKDAQGATITQITKAAEAHMGGGMGAKEMSMHLTESMSQPEQTGRVSGPNEHKEDAEVEEVPTKRRKITLAEYTALGRGIGAQPERASGGPAPVLWIDGIREHGMFGEDAAYC
jgi:hypothetical protein